MKRIGENAVFIECALCPRWNFSKEEIKRVFIKLSAINPNIIPVTIPVLCSADKSKMALLKLRDRNLDQALVFSCGVGAQIVSEVLDIPVIPLLDTKGIAKKEDGKFEEYCSGCSECTIHETAGICVKTRCPKHLLNGPCDGVRKGGMCEVNPDKRCVWVEVYERMKRFGRLEEFIRVRG